MEQLKETQTETLDEDEDADEMYDDAGRKGTFFSG